MGGCPVHGVRDKMWEPDLGAPSDVSVACPLTRVESVDLRQVRSAGPKACSPRLAGHAPRSQEASQTYKCKGQP